MTERDRGGRVELPKGTFFDYRLPRLAKGNGVQVTVEQDGLTTPWLRWEHDTAGVLWQAPESR
jgi:hypothetical protein